MVNDTGTCYWSLKQKVELIFKKICSWNLWKRERLWIKLKEQQVQSHDKVFFFFPQGVTVPMFIYFRTLPKWSKGSLTEIIFFWKIKNKGNLIKVESFLIVFWRSKNIPSSSLIWLSCPVEVGDIHWVDLKFCRILSSSHSLFNA